MPFFFQTNSSGSSSGGGGSSLQWYEDALAPIASYENGLLIYSYVDGVGIANYLYAVVKVPNTYTSGTQIFMRGTFYSDGTSGTILMQTLTTLIRTGVDQMSSTTNQRTSTNSAVTLSAGTVDEPQAVTWDLSDSSGQINSTAVSAGDLLIIRLTRDTGTDTATSDADVPVYAMEVNFS